jgi:hypothetical protein
VCRFGLRAPPGVTNLAELLAKRAVKLGYGRVAAEEAIDSDKPYLEQRRIGSAATSRIPCHSSAALPEAACRFGLIRDRESEAKPTIRSERDLGYEAQGS